VTEEATAQRLGWVVRSTIEGVRDQHFSYGLGYTRRAAITQAMNNPLVKDWYRKCLAEEPELRDAGMEPWIPHEYYIERCTTRFIMMIATQEYPGADDWFWHDGEPEGFWDTGEEPT
jgi:hypothetical protein